MGLVVPGHSIAALPGPFPKTIGWTSPETTLRWGAFASVKVKVKMPRFPLFVLQIFPKGFWNMKHIIAWIRHWLCLIVLHFRKVWSWNLHQTRGCSKPHTANTKQLSCPDAAGMVKTEVSNVLLQVCVISVDVLWEHLEHDNYSINPFWPNVTLRLWHCFSHQPTSKTQIFKQQATEDTLFVCLAAAWAVGAGCSGTVFAGNTPIISRDWGIVSQEFSKQNHKKNQLHHSWVA